MLGLSTLLIRDLYQRGRRRQREREKSNRLINQNKNSARASHVLVYFFAVTARLGREIS